jgi:membrane protease YdiL (CAAX protease family)
MLPSDRRERRLWWGISVTAGVVEELLFRGFLIWYFAAMLPLAVAALVASISFGVGHAYQGVKGVVGTGGVGLLMSALYLLSGSLWLPMILHAAVDVLQMRMALEARAVA